MITVNPIYINYTLSPLIGGADSEEDFNHYSYINSNKEEDIKNLAKEVLLPDFLKQKKELRNEVKNALAYYLIYPKIDFESIFNSLLLPIATPSNSRVFFQWIWEVFFENESKDFITEGIVVEDFDVNAPLYLLTKTGGYNTPLN